MAPKHLAAIGIYPTATQAEVGVDGLIANGFDSAGVSVLLPEQANKKSLPHEQHSKAGAVTAVGATAGGALFASLAVIAGAGALAIPGIGPLVAAGPLVAGLAGLGVGGALGGVTGALVARGLPEDEAKRYVTHVGAGRTLVVCDCATPEEVLKAKGVLQKAGAEDVSSSNA